jgi:hypothetical protein
MGSAGYYLGLAVASLAIGIYNFSLYSDGKNLQCFKITQMDWATYKLYNESLQNGQSTAPASTTSTLRNLQTSDSTNSTSTDDKLYDVQESSSNLYSLLAIIIAIVYLILCGLSLMLAMIINHMANQVPEDFLNIGRCKRWLACFTKILPPFFIIIHWVVLLIIIGFWAMVLMKSCPIATTNEVGVVIVNKQKFHNDSYTLNIVNSAIWVLLHYGGAVIRDIMYQEPFMYSPDIGTPGLCKSLLFKKLGP